MWKKLIKHLLKFSVALSEISDMKQKVVMQLIISEDSCVLHTGSSVDILETMAT